ncbi:MAG TPA: putative lipopolysaccharide heptosyltransferase III [Burkholderiales bacterium]|nr:putative lipopolysaccharide heptosyltransferase III [Burkholderiales bacterium]
MSEIFLPPDAVPLDQVRRVLVIKLRNLGDVLLASPVISTLKSRAPHLEVDALVYADTADMLRGHPGLTVLHEIDRSWKRMGAWQRFRGELRLLSAMRRRNYDLIVHLTEHVRGIWAARLLRPRFSVAPDLRPARYYRKSFTHRYPVIGGNRRHTVDINLDALRRIGVYPDKAGSRLVLSVDAPAVAAVEKAMAQNGLRERSFILVHPGSRWFFKCWPPQRVAAFCDALVAEGRQVVLVSGPDAIEKRLLSEAMRHLAQPVPHFPGTFSLKELAALIAKARLYFGMDSAPMHIAAAMGTPTVALFGPSGDIEWGPWQVANRIVTSSHPCRPCGKDGCGGGKRSDCLEVLEPQQVLDAVHSLLEQTA